MKLEDANGNLLDFTNNAVNSQTLDKWYGDEGDDIIFGGSKTNESYLFGGSGDDKLYGPHDPQGQSFLLGGEDRDLIRTDYYQLTDTPSTDVGT